MDITIETITIEILPDETPQIVVQTENDFVVHSISIAEQGPEGPTGPAGNSESAITSFVSLGTSPQVIDTFSYTTYGSAKYIVYVTSGTTRQICELLVLHDNISPLMVEYANMVTSELLAVFSVDLINGFVRLLTTPSLNNANFKIYRTLLPA
jgi:hypothetical protein